MRRNRRTSTSRRRWKQVRHHDYKDHRRRHVLRSWRSWGRRALSKGWKTLIASQERTKFDRDTLNQEKHDNVTDPTSTGEPVSGHESTKRCVLTHKHVENDQTSTGKPVTVDQKEERKIDFRVPGLSHAVVKEAEHLRVQELVKKYRKSSSSSSTSELRLHSFNKDSKEMIRELGNVELFELCETTPLVQCSHCLLDWNQGIVYCTCGHCLIDSESRRNF